MNSSRVLQNGRRIHLVDKKGRQYALTLKAGETFQYSGETIPHDELIGKASWTTVKGEIDRLVYALSDLTPDDIAFVEPVR